MLIKKSVLQGIASGDIDLAFRCWKRPTVKQGGTLRTAIGVLAIESIEVTTRQKITDEDSRRAGYASRSELLEGLSGREGTVFRISLCLSGEDPRAALAQQQPTLEELVALDRRLRRLKWAIDVLRLIQRWPRRRAPDLADEFGLPTDRFKPRVRRLKEFGLTKSLKVGYELSPRGRCVLEHLERGQA